MTFLLSCVDAVKGIAAKL